MKKSNNIGIGLVISGTIVVFFSAIILSSTQEEKRINAIGDAAFLDTCELKELGLEPPRGSLADAFGPRKDCDAPDPLRVQEGISASALAFGVILILSGGVLMLVGRKNPELSRRGRLSSPPPKLRLQEGDLDEKLRALHGLRKDGLLTESEYKVQKRKLLGDS